MLIVSGSDINHLNLVILQERIEGTVKLRDSGLGRGAFGSFRAASIHSGNFRVGLGIDSIDHPALSNVAGADDAPLHCLLFVHLRILSLAYIRYLLGCVIAPHRTDVSNSGREFSRLSTQTGFPTPFCLRNDHAYCPQKLLVADVVLRGAVDLLYKHVYILASDKGTNRVRD